MQKNKSMKKYVSRFLVCGAFAISAISIQGCDLARNQLKADREGSLEVQDYKDALASRVTEPVDSSASSGSIDIPALQPYIASGSNEMKSMPLVSLAVNQSVPLKDILFELAKQAEYDLELDPNIRGSIIFTAKNRPFDQVVARIADIAGLRYKFEDDILRVEVDNPYNELYKIDYLSYMRSTSGGIRNNVNVVSGDGADTGSEFEATSESEIDFWGELETNLNQLVGGQSTGALKTSRDPRITVAEQNPNVESTSGEVVEATLNVEQIEEPDDNNSSRRGAENESSSTFTINKQAGLISVFATEREHAQVRKYLAEVKKAVTSQVQIEAKILQVELNDQYQTGIDWSAVGLFSGELAFDFDTPSASTPSSGFTLGYTGDDVTALIDALSTFGQVKALASPRVTVLNNQAAVMNVATNVVFFDVEVDTSTETDGGVTTRDTDVDAEIRNVPEGVLVNVQPSINSDTRQISMALRPTITRVQDRVENPALIFAAAQAGITLTEDSEVPQLNVQEIDTIIKVNSGQPVVLGGLLQDRIDTTENAVPVLGEVPIFGHAFKNHNDTISKVELVIFLKATILDSPSESIHNTDKDLYRKFSGDRRPFRF